MAYDFETVLDRSGGSSFKWDEIRQKYPNAPSSIPPLSMADMEFKNPPEMIEGLKKHLDAYPLGYAGPTDSYRRAVCGWMKRRHNWEVDPAWLVPMPGVLPGLFAAIQVLTKPGDGIIHFSPVFGWFRNGTVMNGRKPVPCSLMHDGGEFDIDFEALERLAAEESNTALIFCNPHNPTSHVWSEEDLRRVSEICLRHGLVLISDEVHSDLIMPGFHQVSMGGLDQRYDENLVVCTAPSKTFNMAGMQAGNLIIPNAEKRKAVAERMICNGLFTLGPLGFKACEIAYNDCEAWLDACIAQVWENHLALKAFVAEHMPGIRAYDMQATYLQWMDCRKIEPDPKKLEDKLCEALVFLDQGTDFGEEGAGFVRMNLACPKQVMLDALERMKKALYQ